MGDDDDARRTSIMRRVRALLAPALGQFVPGALRLHSAESYLHTARCQMRSSVSSETSPAGALIFFNNSADLALLFPEGLADHSFKVLVGMV